MVEYAALKGARGWGEGVTDMDTVNRRPLMLPPPPPFRPQRLAASQEAAGAAGMAALVAAGVARLVLSNVTCLEARRKDRESASPSSPRLGPKMY